MIVLWLQIMNTELFHCCPSKTTIKILKLNLYQIFMLPEAVKTLRLLLIFSTAVAQQIGPGMGVCSLSSYRVWPMESLRLL